VATGLQEVAAESFDKLVPPKYNGEASLSKGIVNTDTLCKVSGWSKN
jgi:hypothetical protein